MTDSIYHAIVEVTAEEMAELERQAPIPVGLKPRYYSTTQNGVVKFWPPFGRQHLALYWKEA
jgi:hypothetical protein